MINEFDNAGTFQVALNEIVADKKLQPRSHKLNDENLESLVNSLPDTWPAVLVGPVKDGKRVLVSGFHRVEAAREIGLLSIKAREVEPDLEVAYEQNIAHGLQLTMAERKNYAKLLHERHPQMSQSDIAKKSHLSEASVSRILNVDPNLSPEEIVGNRRQIEQNMLQSLKAELDRLKEEYSTETPEQAIYTLLTVIDRGFAGKTINQALVMHVIEYISVDADGAPVSEKEFKQMYNSIEQVIAVLSDSLNIIDENRELR